MIESLTLQFDGGSRGNPGPAGIGIVLFAPDNTVVYALGRPIGRATNNVAEYKALITGLQQALELGAKQIKVHGDSELIVKQMLGQYKVKHPDMKVLWEEAQSLMNQFAVSSIGHNYRDKNELADKLVNAALDKKRDVSADDLRDDPLATGDAPTINTDRGAQFICARCGFGFEVTHSTGIRPHQAKDPICVCGNKMRNVE